MAWNETQLKFIRRVRLTDTEKKTRNLRIKFKFAGQSYLYLALVLGAEMLKVVMMKFLKNS